MTSPGPTPVEAAGGDPLLPPPLPLRRRWSPVAELRFDLRAAAIAAALIGVAGLPAGLLWWWLAPRANFVVGADGGITPIGNPSPELRAGGDVVFALVLAGLGLLAGLALWFRRDRRGVAALLALSLGTTLAGLVAWLVGSLLAPSPTQEQLRQVGARLTTGLGLESLPALAAGPFAAVLAYLLAVLLHGGDDLGRRERPSPDRRQLPADPAAAMPPPGWAPPGAPPVPPV